MVFQSAEQPSPDRTLPSSHTSPCPASTLPSPQRGAHDPVTAQGVPPSDVETLPPDPPSPAAPLAAPASPVVPALPAGGTVAPAFTPAHPAIGGAAITNNKNRCLRISPLPSLVTIARLLGHSRIGLRPSRRHKTTVIAELGHCVQLLPARRWPSPSLRSGGWNRADEFLATTGVRSGRNGSYRPNPRLSLLSALMKRKLVAPIVRGTRNGAAGPRMSAPSRNHCSRTCPSCPRDHR